jgi:hypothetical protein
MTEVVLLNSTVYTHLLGLKKAVGLTNFVATDFNPLKLIYKMCRSYGTQMFYFTLFQRIEIRCYKMLRAYGSLKSCV